MAPASHFFHNVSPHGQRDITVLKSGPTPASTAPIKPPSIVTPGASQLGPLTSLPTRQTPQYSLYLNDSPHPGQDRTSPKPLTRLFQCHVPASTHLSSPRLCPQDPAQLWPCVKVTSYASSSPSPCVPTAGVLCSCAGPEMRTPWCPHVTPRVDSPAPFHTWRDGQAQTPGYMVSRPS